MDTGKQAATENNNTVLGEDFGGAFTISLLP